MTKWSVLTNHGRVLVCIAQDPSVRLRDVAEALDVTERTVSGIVTELARSGYLVKERDGRRNRYLVQHQQSLPEPVGRKPLIGDLLEVLVDARQPERGT
jgi:predicted transcriptional regulator